MLTLNCIHKTINKLSIYTICCILLLCSACKKEKATSNNPTPPAISSLSFSYGGHKTGIYSATGEIPDAQSTYIWEHRWATAKSFSDFGTGWVLINACVPTGNGSDIVQLHVPSGKTGSFPLISDFGNDAVNFGYGVNDELYGPTSGTIIVTTSTKEHLAGTFSGMATNVNDPSKSITITNGKFDLRVTPQ